jgi:hypothetical protein
MPCSGMSDNIRTVNTIGIRIQKSSGPHQRQGRRISLSGQPYLYRHKSFLLLFFKKEALSFYVFIASKKS